MILAAQIIHIFLFEQIMWKVHYVWVEDNWLKIQVLIAQEGTAAMEFI